MNAKPTDQSGLLGRAGAAMPTLARLVGADLRVFADQVWGRRPLLRRCDAPGREGFGDLLSRDAIDQLLAERGLRTPFLRVARSGTTLPDRSFTDGGGVGAQVADQVSDDKVHRLFVDGSTIVLQGLHRIWPPLVEFAQDLAADLGHPVQMNAYVTPPQSQGFATHYDVHDVFVLQLFGHKRWSVHGPVHPLPLRDQPWTERREEVAAAGHGPPALAGVLAPGDCLYLPRGYLHSAVALGEVSGHLTVGVHPWTGHTLAQDVTAAALADLAADPDIRAALPVGVDVADPDQVAANLIRVKAALVSAIARIDAGGLARSMHRRSRESQRAAPLFPLVQAATARQVGVDTPVVLRRHLHPRSERTESGGMRVVSRAGVLEIPADEVVGMPLALDGLPFTAADLPLPEDAAIELVRRLLGGAIVVPSVIPSP